ncbi:uncharacterized protein LOC127002114 [Eriocheir sinensis]|uniref:uncharacterized protein LOC127002114 n=1 Tax=Eriocheir sinensis TaxID=95602 RepID=UPI0021C5892F|nr:uncharacterized protein LOC127002114 [Eriocheir sinensis]
MKVLICSSLVLSVLLVLVTGQEPELDREAFWRSFFVNQTAEVCEGRAELCQANSARCLKLAESDKYKVKNEETAAEAKMLFTECAKQLSIKADFSDVTLRTFEELFPLPGYGFDLLGMLLHYGVPQDKISPMTACSGSYMLNDLKECLVSKDVNQA